ncbi:MAG: phosphatidylglycerophosphatase A [Alphaproteobacteria bacterium]|nr:phosphatidylglycerophosphatase A [Alphaproteobacteria bacterium]
MTKGTQSRPHGVAAQIATGFGLGYLPVAPGTWASLATVPVAVVLTAIAGFWGTLGIAFAITIIGIWASEATARQSAVADPPAVVIDEIAGQLIALAPASGDPLALAVGFVAFRVLDIVKPGPIGRAESLRGGIGIMADDVLAGLAAGALVALTPAVAGFF